MKKILYFGGQKSGKTRLAELKALELSQDKKPFYVATYDNSYGDEEMLLRVRRHKMQREEKFETIEEQVDLSKVIKEGGTYLIDCLSMWILNNIEAEEEALVSQISKLLKVDANIIFVLNEVASGVIPLDKQSRKFVDMTGIIGQKIASICDEVYEVKFGIAVRIK